MWLVIYLALPAGFFAYFLALLMGLGYLALAAPVFGWGQIVDGAALTLTGAVAIAFGLATIGPRAIADRARRRAE